MKVTSNNASSNSTDAKQPKNSASLLRTLHSVGVQIQTRCTFQGSPSVRNRANSTVVSSLSLRLAQSHRRSVQFPSRPGSRNAAIVESPIPGRRQDNLSTLEQSEASEVKVFLIALLILSWK